MDENYDSILLSGLTMSLVGCGNVGSALLSLLRPFGGKMLADYPWIHPNVFEELGVAPAPLEECIQRAAGVFRTGAVTVANVGGSGKRYLELMPSAGVVLESRAGGSILTNCLTRRPLGKCALELMSGRRSRSRRTSRTQDAKHPAASASRGQRPEIWPWMGHLVVDEMELILNGLTPQRCQKVRWETVAKIRSKPVK